MGPLSLRAGMGSFSRPVITTRGSASQPRVHPLPLWGGGVLLAGAVAAAAYVCFKAEEETPKDPPSLKQIPVLSLPPPSLKKDLERRIMARSIAQSDSPLLRNLIYNFVRSNSYEGEEVSEFLFEYVKELHQPDAHPDSKGSVAKWLYALKAFSRSDYNSLLTRLHSEKFLPELFKNPIFRPSYESGRIMDELYSDYQELKLK